MNKKDSTLTDDDKNLMALLLEGPFCLPSGIAPQNLIDLGYIEVHQSQKLDPLPGMSIGSISATWWKLTEAGFAACQANGITLDE